MQPKQLVFKIVAILTHLCSVSCLILGTSSIAFGQWTRKADEISQRAECNNVLYRNKLYVFSGFGNNPIIEKTNEVYDIATNKWSRIASFPVGKEVTHQGVLLVDDEIWIIGGRAIGAYGPASSKVLIYHITTNSWTDGPELIDPSNGKAFPMGAGGYVLLGRTIHVFGGFGPTMCVDQATVHLTLDVDKYRADKNTTTWENKLAPLPIPRNHISYVVLAGRIYVFGGQFLHDCGAADQKYCHVYDPITDKWTRLADLPVPRSHAEAATFAVDGKMFLVGGQGKDNITQNTVYQYTPQAPTGPGYWSLLSAYKLPGSYLGLSSKIAGKSFIITNGALNVYSNERKETYIANVTRSNNRTFGFSASCLSLSSVTGQQVTMQNLLYVLEDETTYNITTDAQWLTVSKNGTGSVNLNGTVIHLNINTTDLSAGNYTGKVTATGVLTGSKTSFCVNLTVLPSSGYTLTVTTSGSGTVTKTPNEPAYSDSSEVIVNAAAATGWLFNGWSGDTVSQLNPLMLTINKNTTLKANFIPDSSILISDIKPKTTGVYAIGELVTGTNYYTDRDYTITSVPTFLTNTTFIKTANNDKTLNSSVLLTFNLNRAATIYVGYDSRATRLPAWLSTWKKTTEKLTVTDSKLPGLTLYTKYFPAGTVSLGGNMASPATGALCQYLIIALEDTTSSNLAKMLLASTFSSQLAQAALNNYPNTDKDVLVKPFLYPNPVRTTLQVVFPVSYQEPAVLRLISMTGLVHNLSNSVFKSSGNVIDVNLEPLGLRQGTYALHVTYGKGKVYVVRFVKE
jgi:N-acetylneuraminic acid mutarotase